MRPTSTALTGRGSLLLLAFILLALTGLRAQTTITTLPATVYNGGNSLGSPAQVTFVLQNTNAFPILITGIQNYMTTADNNSVWSLHYSTTALSGAATDVTTAPWILIATSLATPAVGTGSIQPLNFPGLSFVMPAGAEYRFALRNIGPGNCRYSGTGAVLSPNTFSAGGVNMKLGDVQIAGTNVGYSGSGTALTITPRYFTGAVTFQPFGPCTNPPVPGTVTTTANPVCLNVPFTLGLSGGTGGAGQTHQWQSSPDNSTWTNIPGATNNTLTTSQAVTTFYRCVVTCGTTVNSTSIQILTPGLVAGFYTINNTLPTGGTNFNSYNAAYDFIKCGINGPVTFNVAAGTGPYNEQLIMDPVPGASSVNTVTFNGNGTTLNFNSTNTNQRGIVKLNGADHIRFDGINITSPGTLTTEYAFGFHLLNDADSNIVRNCNITLNTSSTSTNYAGIVVSGSATSATTGSTTVGNDFNQFVNNTITGGYYGMTLTGTSTFANGRNIISRNRFLENYNYGVYVTGSFNTLIDSNLISRPTRATVTTLFGIFFTGLSTRATVSRNTITNPFGGAPSSTSLFNGIHFTGVDALPALENRVINNSIYNITGSGDSYGLHNISSDNVYYYHNTVSMDGPAPAATATTITRGFFQTTLAAGIEFRNNIITLSRAGNGNKHCIYFATNTSTIGANRNDYFINTATGNVFTGFFTANQASLANWQAASGQDANSVASNPIYVNLGSGNLLPTNATINDLGAPLGITNDILGLPRSATAPDIGAWEFTPGNCIAPPTAGTASVSPSPVCVNSPVLLSLSGYSLGLGQTYQWQSSATLAGPWTNVGALLTNPDLGITSSTTLYYRCVVTCSGISQFSDPVQLVVNPALPGGTYTINKTAPASATNFISFNAAYAAMACGIAGPVVINVVPGTGPYNEQLVMDSVAGTSAVNTITFNGNGNTIAFSSANTNERAVIKLRKTDFVTFDSLTIDSRGAGGFGVGVQLINNADNNTVRRCNIITETNNTSTNYAGIVVNAADAGATSTGATNCDDNTFSGNTITGGFYGVTLVSAAATQMYRNRVLNNRFINYYSYGTYILGSSNSKVDGNDYSRPTNTIVTAHYGVYMLTSAIGDTISNNRIHDPFRANATTTSVFYGIFMTGVDATAAEPNRIYNNIVYSVTGEGDQYGIYNTSSDHALYYHNTLNFDDQTSVHSTTWWTRAFQQATAATGVEWRNNIVSISRTGFGDRHAVYLSNGTAGITLNYNNYYVVSTTPGGSPPNTGFNGGDQLTLANWQTSTTQEANSKNFDPIYTNAATGNLEPQFGPLDNQGTPAGIATDIRGLARSATTPDMGAFEFNIPPCVNPPTAGVSVVTPNTGICIGTPIVLTLTGNSTGAFQTYVWQSAPSAAGPWTDISGTLFLPAYNSFASSSNFYRCRITCSSGTPVFSTPASISLNPALLAGTYTVNPAAPLSASNYQTVAQAVAALDCGITGTVIFNIATGTYTEQIRMKPVFGTSPTARVIFQSASGVPADVKLTFNSTTAAANYTLKLDSSSYITWRNMTIEGTNATNGRVIELAATSSFDTLRNLVINAPNGTGTGNTIAGIFSSNLRGRDNVIMGNTINRGNSGIFIAAPNATSLTRGLVIDSNNIVGHYFYGIYTSLTNRVRVNRNTLALGAGMNTTAYGIYADQPDTLYQFVANRIAMNNTAGTVYGMYLNNGDASLSTKGLIASNTIIAATGNTSTMYGLYNNASNDADFLNNVISINTSGATSYGLYSTQNALCNYFNNSVNSQATSATNNFAAYFNHTSGATGNADIRNNIFSHQSGGIAMFIVNTNFLYLDYNLLYTTGGTLIRAQTATNYANINAWRTATGWDVNSIVAKPAFVSNTDLQPLVSDPTVWIMHGRGVQIAGNNRDFNNNARPTTLAAGVPDLGAYEFTPTSIPPDMVAIPATPVANSTQVFMFATDTVAKVNWGASVPATVSGKRYSGVTPPGLAAPADKFMYFYTDFTIPAGSYNYTMNQFYIDPWQGYIPNETQIRLAKTNQAGAWTTFSGTQSTLDDGLNIMTKTGLTDMFKFTGLINGVSLPTVIAPPDSSNRGTRFWVPYAHNFYYESDNSQNMVLYLSAEQAANVRVKINGTAWVRNYAVPANSVITSVVLPKIGVDDSRVRQEGLSNRGISIVSDVPIVAYAHVYGSASSGATMLLPVGAYGYEYKAITSRQNYSNTAFSHVNVIAEYDSTVVEITPSSLTRGGRPAGVPFTVVLNRGDVYQILGELTSPTGAVGLDLTGTKARALPNSAGKCLPFAMFSGSSRTAIVCGGTAGGGNGDYIIQQNFPVQAWGRKYLTAPTSNSSAANSFHTNIYRIAVKDTATRVFVTRTGIPTELPRASLIGGLFYELETQEAIYIEADQPVVVAQFMSSSNSNCANSGGSGDPEMFYISPLEQAVNRVGFYRNTVQNITLNYLTLIIPTGGVPSLRIDGSNVFDHTYPHPNLAGYTVVVKRWTAAQAQTIVQSDSAFTAITYGQGSVESYGYNAGTLVKNLNGLPAIVNSNYTGPGNSTYTCAKTPFRFNILIPVKPTVLQWGFSQVANLTPNTDVIQNNPVPLDSVVINGRKYYKYSVAADYVMSVPGAFVVPIYITHPEIEGCNSRLEVSLVIDVKPAPTVDFTSVFTGCVGDAVQFNGSAVPQPGVPVNSWSWSFGDATTSNIQNPSKLYANPGTYNVRLNIVANDGCLGDTTKQIVVNPRPVVTMVRDSIAVCAGDSIRFQVQNPAAGGVYTWYTTPTGGTPVATGTSYTVFNVTNTVTFYVEALVNGCVSVARRRVVGAVLPPLAPPVVSVDSLGTNLVRFRWNAVPNAASYEVSVNGSSTWITPSSGAAGLTHTVTGLVPLQTVTLAVRAIGIISCQTSVSATVSGRTLPDQIYIPNAFSPNGDGLNDVLLVYGYVIRDMQLVVYNQWGEKIFESSNQGSGWNGTYKGKPQPAGVYMYVCRITRRDGVREERKGSVNLVR